MAQYKIAHIREQGQDIIIIPLDGNFNSKSQSDQNQTIEALQACAISAGLAGTVVPVWRVGNSHRFIAPTQWQSYFKSLTWNTINPIGRGSAPINRDRQVGDCGNRCAVHEQSPVSGGQSFRSAFDRRGREVCTRIARPIQAGCRKVNLGVARSGQSQIRRNKLHVLIPLREPQDQNKNGNLLN